MGYLTFGRLSTLSHVVCARHYAEQMRVSPLGGRRPTRAELADFEDGTVDDIACPDPWLLIVGVNPGLWTAAVNAPFAAPSNRFWPSLYEAGIMPHRVDAAAGLSASDESHMIRRGIGLTNLVNRATVRAAELTKTELAAGESAYWTSQRDSTPTSSPSWGLLPIGTRSTNRALSWANSFTTTVNRFCSAAQSCGFCRNRVG